MKKYRIDKEDSVTVGKQTFYRIIALRDFSNVKKGDKGGFIQHEDSLSHTGWCWIYDNAKVSGTSRVTNNAVVKGEAAVRGRFIIADEVVISGRAKLLGKGLLEDRSKVCDETYVLGTVRLRDEATISGNAYVNGELLMTGDAKLISGACIFGFAAFSYETVIGITLDKIGYCTDVQLLDERDVIIFKDVGPKPASLLIGFKREGKGIMVYHKFNTTHIDRFEQHTCNFFENSPLPNREAWLKDYKNKINYIRETLTTYSEGFNDD